ncbi:MAG: SusD/RagB family nutrient-binding outer membrane lipoprotein [Bacteroidales bacterium]|nr:SusD/RagB family nutrient-binding outer membrane lipoprotein [Bacteroidales bacterium]
MKKIVKTYSLVLSLIFILSACESWLDINTDPNSPAEDAMTENVYLPGIEAEVAYELTGGFPARYPNYWMLQVGRDAAAPDFATYDIDESDPNNMWTYSIYTSSLKNAVKLNKLAEDNGNFHYAGIAKVISAYILAITTDCFGDIPWIQAFQPEVYPFPVFDSQESIYNTIQTLLDDAIANFNTSEEGQELRPGDEDYIYGGDINQWTKFAYTLKARYAIRLTYAPGKTGAGQADIALAALANGLNNTSDNPGIEFSTSSGAEAPWYQWHIKWETIAVWANEYMVNLMNSKNDPRRAIYFTQTITDDYVGHRTGNMLPTNRYDSVSEFSNDILAADETVFWITYDEAKMLEAEAYLWKNQPAEAKTSLDDAIRANMQRLGLSNGEIDSYIASIGPLPADFEQALKMIMEEKYVSNFLSTEVWNDQRRTGYPVISSADIDNPTYSNVPLRFMYPADVKQNNPDNEPDVNWLTDPVWWDNK